MPFLSDKEVHYNDWPNSQGFDVRYEEKSPVELKVTGNIPAYAAGVLFRTGLGPRTVETEKGTTFRTKHWFDSLAQVHRFQIHSPTSEQQPVKITYNSRITCDGVIERIKKAGKDDAISFAAKYDICTSYFQKLKGTFLPAPSVQAPNQINQSVSISPNFPGLSPTGVRQQQPSDHSKIVNLVNKTDTTYLQMLDPQTLEPIGLAKQQTLHPSLKGDLSATHAKSDPKTGDVFNYNLQLGRAGVYRVFVVSALTGDTSILATFSAAPAYIHSLFLTENYVVLCIWNSFYSMGGVPILYHKNIVDALADYDSTRPASWYVIDRKSVEQGGKGLIGVYESADFFAFHAINAFEETNDGSSQKDIIADVVGYDNIDCVKRFYLDNMVSNSSTAYSIGDQQHNGCRSSIRRFRLTNVPAEPTKKHLKADLVFSEGHQVSMELPVINHSMVTRKHRYVYGASDTGKSTFFDGLVKYDTQTHTSTLWSHHGQTAGEPIFVADPESEDEDGGVLLSVVLDGIEGHSYLLVLDAKTMEEVGRAAVDGVVGFGFHGTHVPATGDPALHF